MLIYTYMYTMGVSVNDFEKNSFSQSSFNYLIDVYAETELFFLFVCLLSYLSVLNGFKNGFLMNKKFCIDRKRIFLATLQNLFHFYISNRFWMNKKLGKFSEMSVKPSCSDSKRFWFLYFCLSLSWKGICMLPFLHSTLLKFKFSRKSYF